VSEQYVDSIMHGATIRVSKISLQHNSRYFSV